MALAQRFSLVRFGNDRLVSDQQSPTLFLDIPSEGCLAAGKLLIPRVKIHTGANLGLGPLSWCWLLKAFSDDFPAFFEFVADGCELFFFGEVQVGSRGVEGLGIDFYGMVFGAIGSVLSDLFFLEIARTVPLYSQALLRDGYAELSLPILLLLRLLHLLGPLGLAACFHLASPHKLVPPPHHVLILLINMPQHHKVTVNAPHLLLWTTGTVPTCFLGQKVAL